MNNQEQNLIFRMQDLIDEGFSVDDAFDISMGNKTTHEVMEERFVFRNIDPDTLYEEKEF